MSDTDTTVSLPHADATQSQSCDVVTINLDASLLKKAYCDRAFYFTGIKGLHSRFAEEPLVMGKALHKFAHKRGAGAEFAEALKPSMAYYTDHGGADIAKLANAVSAYPNELYAPALALEKYFHIPYLETYIDNVKYVVNLCGTIDRMGILEDENRKRLIAYDYKSTRKYKVDEVINSYRYSIQFMFYYWILRRYSHLVVPTEVQHLCAEGNVFVCPCPVMLSAKPIVWRRGPYLNYEHMMEQLDTLIRASAEAAIELARMTEWPAPTGMMSDQCSACQFAPVCHTTSMSMSQQIMDSLFESRFYDPSAF